MVWRSEVVGHRQPVGRAGSIEEGGRRERHGNGVGCPEPAELSTGGRQGEAAHPLHLAMRSKNDRTGCNQMKYLANMAHEIARKNTKSHAIIFL